MKKKKKEEEEVKIEEGWRQIGREKKGGCSDKSYAKLKAITGSNVDF
jgi:hypothetical protein